MKKETKQFIAGLLGAATVFSTSACAKIVDCDIKSNHSHNYVNDEGYIWEIKSEREFIEKFYRTDDYQNITDEDNDRLRMIYFYDLIRIDDNLDRLLELESSLYDYKQYEYSYTERKLFMVGKTASSRLITCYDYTNNKNAEDLTGNERIVTHKFRGYKLVYDEKGRIDMIKSEPMDSIEELVNAGYEYVRYNKLYAGYDRETNEFIEYEDDLGPDKVSGLVLKKH